MLLLTKQALSVNLQCIIGIVMTLEGITSAVLRYCEVSTLMNWIDVLLFPSLPFLGFT